MAAEVAGFLPFTETALLAELAPAAQRVLALGAAWEPLVLEQRVSGRLLRCLRELDPLGTLPPEACPVPGGLRRVSELRVELMEPDHAELELSSPELAGEPLEVAASAASGRDSSPEADAAATAAVAAVAGDLTVRLPGPDGVSACELRGGRRVLDPLEELCRRLRRGWFPSLMQIEVSNVEDHRLDYRFLQLRGTVLGDFPYVRVNTAPGARYTLTASRRPGLRVPRVLDARVAAAVSAARRPAESHLPSDRAQVIGVAEALFLQEHTGAFKSGDAFHVAHAPWRTFPGSLVRRRYGALLEVLAQRAGEAAEEAECDRLVHQGAK